MEGMSEAVDQLDTKVIYIYCKSYNDYIWWHHDLSMPVQPKPMPSGILSLNFVRAVDCRLMWRWTKLSFALCGWYHHSWSRDIQAPSVCFVRHGETLQFSASPQSFISFMQATPPSLHLDSGVAAVPKSSAFADSTLRVLRVLFPFNTSCA